MAHNNVEYVYMSNVGNLQAPAGENYLPQVFFFSFFLYHVFIVKVQEPVWSTSYDVNKTIKQSNGLLHLIIGQTKTPHPNQSNQT